MFFRNINTDQRNYITRSRMSASKFITLKLQLYLDNYNYLIPFTSNQIKLWHTVYAFHNITVWSVLCVEYMHGKWSPYTDRKRNASDVCSIWIRSFTFILVMIWNVRKCQILPHVICYVYEMLLHISHEASTEQVQMVACPVSILCGLHGCWSFSQISCTLK